MAKIKLIVCDDEGNPISEVEVKDYTLEVGKQTLGEIEAAVEKLVVLQKIPQTLFVILQYVYFNPHIVHFHFFVTLPYLFIEGTVEPAK